MASKNEVSKLQRKSRIAALEGLHSAGGFPVPPRKAMSQAKKRSKALHYPVAPYPSANPISLYRWASAEWQSLGRWQQLALPVVAIVALTTWEKETELRNARWEQIDREEAKQIAAASYGAYGPSSRKKKRFFGLPFLNRKK